MIRYAMHELVCAEVIKISMDDCVEPLNDWIAHKVMASARVRSPPPTAVAQAFVIDGDAVTL